MLIFLAFFNLAKLAASPANLFVMNLLNPGWPLIGTLPVSSFTKAQSFCAREFTILLLKRPAFWASKYSTDPSKNQIVSGTHKISFARQLLKNHVATPTAIINKEIIHERFNETMKYCEDYEYFTRLTYHFGLYLNPSVLCITSRQKGLSSHLFKMRLGEIRMYLKTAQYCRSVLFLLPFLILYSLIKHVIRTAKIYYNF